MVGNQFLKSEQSKKVLSFVAVLSVVSLAFMVYLLPSSGSASLELVLTDSQIKGVRPGEEASYEFKITNLGDSGQDVKLTFFNVPENWNAELKNVEQDHIHLGAGDHSIFYLSVQAPSAELLGDTSESASIQMEARADKNVSLETTVTYLIQTVNYQRSGDTTEYPFLLDTEVLEGTRFITRQGGMFSLRFEDLATFEMGKDSKLVVNEMIYHPDEGARRNLKFTQEQGSVSFYVDLPTTDSVFNMEFISGGEHYSVQIDHTQETIFSFDFTTDNEGYTLQCFLGSVTVLQFPSRAISELVTLEKGEFYNHGDAEIQDIEVYNLLRISAPSESKFVVFEGDQFLGVGDDGSFHHLLGSIVYLDKGDGQNADEDVKYIITKGDGEQGIEGIYDLQVRDIPAGESVNFMLTRVNLDKYGGDPVEVNLDITPQENADISFLVDNGGDTVSISSETSSYYSIMIAVKDNEKINANLISLSGAEGVVKTHGYTLSQDTFNSNEPVDFAADLDGDDVTDMDTSLATDVTGQEINKEIEQAKQVEEEEDETLLEEVGETTCLILIIVLIIVLIIGVVIFMGLFSKSKKKGRKRKGKKKGAPEESFRAKMARQKKLKEIRGKRDVGAAAALQPIPAPMPLPLDDEEMELVDDTIDQSLAELDQALGIASAKPESRPEPSSFQPPDVPPMAPIPGRDGVPRLPSDLEEEESLLRETEDFSLPDEKIPEAPIPQEPDLQSTPQFPAEEEETGEPEMPLPGADEEAGEPEMSLPGADEEAGEPEIPLPGADEEVGEPEISLPGADEEVGEPEIPLPGADEEVGEPDISLPGEDEGSVEETDEPEIPLPGAGEEAGEPEISLPVEDEETDEPEISLPEEDEESGETPSWMPAPKIDDQELELLPATDVLEEEEEDFLLPEIEEEKELRLETKFENLFEDMEKIESLKLELVNIEKSIRASAHDDDAWWLTWDARLGELLRISNEEKADIQLPKEQMDHLNEMQQETMDENDLDNDPEDDLDNDLDNDPGDDPDNNPEDDLDSNLDNDLDNDPGDDPDSNLDNALDNDPEDDLDSNLDNALDNNPEDDLDSNLEKE